MLDPGKQAAPDKQPGERPRRGRSLLVFALAGLLACAGSWALAWVWPGPPVERATLATLVLVPLWTALLLLGLVAAARRRRAGTPVRAGHARRSLFAIHRRLGAALVVLALLVFGSGVGAVLDRSLAGWQLAHAPREAALPVGEQALDEALAELLRAHPELREGELALHPASAGQPWIQADFFDAERKPVRVDLDPETGAVLARGSGPLWVLRELHRRLLVQPLIGESLLGLLGLGLALVLLSGLATRRWRRELGRAGARNRTQTKQAVRTARPRAMVTHQWLGLGLLGPALIWAWTGALLGLTLVIVPIVGGAAYGGDRAALMRDVLAVDRPPLDAEPSATPSLREAAERRCLAVRERLPDAKVHRMIVRHPGLRSATIRVDLEGTGVLGRGSQTLAADGSLRDCRALPAAGVGLQGFMGAVVLHYGEWETRLLPRVVVDLAYLLLGAALVAVAWLGGSLLARRRAREGDRAGALRLRRWLLCVGLGLPLIAAELALLSRIPGFARDEGVALTLTAASALLLIAWSFTGELRQRRRGLLLLLALTLLAVPIFGWLLAGAALGPVELLAWLTAAGVSLGLWRTAARSPLARVQRGQRRVGVYTR